jgi:hypothetical protein
VRIEVGHIGLTYSRNFPNVDNSFVIFEGIESFVFDVGIGNLFDFVVDGLSKNKFDQVTILTLL